MSDPLHGITGNADAFGGYLCICGESWTTIHEQEVQWEAHVKSHHAKGLCEFSGLRVTQCQKTICDCFETPEGAREIERKAGLRQ